MYFYKNEWVNFFLLEFAIFYSTFMTCIIWTCQISQGAIFLTIVNHNKTDRSMRAF